MTRWHVDPKPLWCITVDLRLFHLEHDRLKPDEADMAAATSSRYIRKTKFITERFGNGNVPYAVEQSVENMKN